jgi:choline kinase
VERLRTESSVAVILAAGTGTRLGQPSKPLAAVASVTLLERAVRTVQRAGIGRVIVVVGHAKDAVERFVSTRGLPVELVENEDFALGNGSSAIVGGRAAGQRFVLMMVDHLVEPEILGRVLRCRAPFAVAVDTRPRSCNVDEATKLRVQDGSVVAVSRELEKWDAIDVGVFACDAAVIQAAESATVHDFDKEKFFEGCLPIEVMAHRGRDTLRFGPMKPVGLVDPRTGRIPYAAVQLRQDTLAGDHFSLVGFQTQLKWGEQARVLRLIPGLERGEFVRYGMVHRNT